MSSPDQSNLSSRERQVMDVLFEVGEATVAEIMEKMPDPPGYSAVRTTVGRLESKGHLKHRTDGPRYIFSPVVTREKARDSAVAKLVGTFFNGSVSQAVSGLLGQSVNNVSERELGELARIIEKAKRGEL